MTNTSTFKDVIFFFIFTTVIIVLFLVSLKFSTEKNSMIFFIVALFVCQYGMNYVSYDFPIRTRNNNILLVDGLYNFVQENDDFIEDIGEMYYYGSYDGRLLTQFLFDDVSLIPGVPSADDEAFVIYSSYDSSIFDDGILDDCKYCVLDNLNGKEYFYIKGEQNFELFESYGFELNDVFDLNLNRDRVIRMYHVLLSRSADEGGLEYWVEQFDEGTISYRDAIETFVNSVEFQSKNYSNKDIVTIFYTMFLDENYKDKIPYPYMFEQREYWIEQLDNGMSVSELLDEFYYSDECVLTEEI